MVRSGLGGRLGGIEQAHRRPSRLPLRGTLAQFVEARRPFGAMQGAGRLDLAGDAMTRDALEDAAGGLAEKLGETLAPLGAERLPQGIRHHPEPGIDEAGIAAGGAEADLDRFEKHDRGATLGEMQRGRGAGEAAAHHDDIRPQVFPQGGGRRRGRCRPLPEPMGAPVVQHARSVLARNRSKMWIRWHNPCNPRRRGHAPARRPRPVADAACRAVNAGSAPAFKEPL